MIDVTRPRRTRPPSDDGHGRTRRACEHVCRRPSSRRPAEEGLWGVLLPREVRALHGFRNVAASRSLAARCAPTSTPADSAEPSQRRRPRRRPFFVRLQQRRVFSQHRSGCGRRGTVYVLQQCERQAALLAQGHFGAMTSSSPTQPSSGRPSCIHRSGTGTQTEPHMRELTSLAQPERGVLRFEEAIPDEICLARFDVANGMPSPLFLAPLPDVLRRDIGSRELCFDGISLHT